MRAVAVTEFGGPEKLALIDAPVPQPAAGEALVKLEYAGINFIDVYMRSGHYARSQTYKTPLPMVIGMEGIGTDESGRRVAYCITRGSYAEYAAVPITVAPRSLAHCTRSWPTPPAAACTRQVCPFSRGKAEWLR